MAKIVDSEALENHSVDRYNFKPLALNDNIADDVVQKPQERRVFMQNDSDIDTSSLSQNSKDSLIESLLKKTDEMSSNFIKLQMRLESMSDEHKSELEKVKKESYEAGVKAGLEEALRSDENTLKDAISRFGTSVLKLEKSSNSFEMMLEDIKKELVAAALDIAKEVVKVEVSQDSSRVALSLAKEIISELSEVSKITLKVNPIDYDKISTQLDSLQNISVVSDSAIAQGGVVAISDSANIDAQIKKRLEKVKKVALGE